MTHTDQAQNTACTPTSAAKDAKFRGLGPEPHRIETSQNLNAPNVYYNDPCGSFRMPLDP